MTDTTARTGLDAWSEQAGDLADQSHVPGSFYAPGSPPELNLPVQPRVAATWFSPDSVRVYSLTLADDCQPEPVAEALAKHTAWMAEHHQLGQERRRLEGSRKSVQAQDEGAYADAIAGDKPDPGPVHEATLDARLKEIGRRRSALRRLIADSYGTVAEAVNEHHAEWVNDLERQAQQATERYQRALTELTEARAHAWSTRWQRDWLVHEVTTDTLPRCKATVAPPKLGDIPHHQLTTQLQEDCDRTPIEQQHQAHRAAGHYQAPGATYPGMDAKDQELAELRAKRDQLEAELGIRLDDSVPTTRPDEGDSASDDDA